MNAHIEGLLAGRPATGPKTVHFDIANACNTRCTTCWHHSPHLAVEHRPSAAWKVREMSLGTFQRIFDEVAAEGGLEQVVLSGMGDPTLNDALYDMVAHVHARGVGVTVITNLLHLDVDRLLASRGQLHVLGSICGVTEAVWQAFHAHPTPSGFQKVLARLERMSERGFRPKHVQVITRQNAAQLPEMVRFARRYPAERISFKLASLARGTEAVALSDADKEALRDALIPRARGMARRYGIATDLDAFQTQILPGSHATAPIADTGCFMGYLYCRVTVEGELLYCCNTAISVGHLDEAVPFGALWRGERYQLLRDQLRRGRYFRGCDQCGKYKQNVSVGQRLTERYGSARVRELTGR